MRDILLTLIVLGSLPLILRRPYIGVLVWSWLSYMNPHRLTWSFAYDQPWAQIVAITLLISIFLNREQLSFPFNRTVGIWLFLIFWMGVTTTFAFFPDSAMIVYIKIIKIQLITFLTMMLITDKEKLDQLIWIIVLSIGYYTVKGGAFTIVTGGGFRVYGPEESYIWENNALALATLMIVPLMVYLIGITKNKWIRYGLMGAVFLSVISAFGSQSRGAFLAIMAVLFFFWLKSKTKIVSGVVIVLFFLGSWNFMPVTWHERMDRIINYEQDESAMGRINAWQYAINVANDRITGAGLQSYRPQTFAMYAPDPSLVKAAHSIYFAMLADHGWIGLGLFLLILFLSWRKCDWIIKTSQGAEYRHVNLLARMLQISMVAYMSGGAFLSLSYFDLPWHMIAIIVLISTWHERNLAAQEPSVADRPRPRNFSMPG